MKEGDNMFIITEKTPEGAIIEGAKTETNNISDIKDIVLNITNDEKEANWAVKTADDMWFGDSYERVAYRLECRKA